MLFLEDINIFAVFLSLCATVPYEMYIPEQQGWNHAIHSSLSKSQGRVWQ